MRSATEHFLPRPPHQWPGAAGEGRRMTRSKVRVFKMMCVYRTSSITAPDLQLWKTSMLMQLRKAKMNLWKIHKRSCTVIQKLGYVQSQKKPSRLWKKPSHSQKKGSESRKKPSDLWQRCTANTSWKRF